MTTMTMTTTTAIEVERLHQRFGDTVALDDLTFRLDGGITGLLGRNGSGKTTLLSILAGFREPSAGSVRVGGEPVFERADVMERVCLIREGGDTVDGSERVSEALAVAAMMRPYWDADYAKHLLDRFRLSDRKKVGQLSRGQRGALACTLGLASRAPLTMFDEAYLGMDAPSRYVFYDELLEDFMAHPRSIIISTHLIEEVSSLFEQVVIIDQGRLVLQDDSESLRSRGVTVLGPAEAVDRFVAGLTVLNERRLGSTKSAVVYGALDEAARGRAAEAGLELEPLPLQDLFVHLTASGPAEEEAR